MNIVSFNEVNCENKNIKYYFYATFTPKCGTHFGMFPCTLDMIRVDFNGVVGDGVPANRLEGIFVFDHKMFVSFFLIPEFDIRCLAVHKYGRSQCHVPFDQSWRKV